jgi:hypothetical protein
MKKFLVLALAAISFCAVAAHAQTGPNQTVIQYKSNLNPCQSVSFPKSTAVISISATGTTAIIAAVTGKKIYLCDFKATITGTTPTLLFLTGTQTTTACDTAAANLSGTFAPTSGSLLSLGMPGGIATTITSGQLCATAGGTTPSVQGVLSYVQQ